MRLRHTTASFDARGNPVVVTTFRRRLTPLAERVLVNLETSVVREKLRASLGWNERRMAMVLGNLWRMGLIESPYDDKAVIIRPTDAGRAVVDLLRGGT